MYGFHFVMKYIPGGAYLPMSSAGCVCLDYSKWVEADRSRASVMSVSDSQSDGDWIVHVSLAISSCLDGLETIVS